MKFAAAFFYLFLSPLSFVTVPIAMGQEPVDIQFVHPTSVCYGPDGSVYVADAGEFGKDDDGSVKVLSNGQWKPFASNLNDPMGIVFFQDAFYVTDKTQIVRIGNQGETSVYASAEDFPAPPTSLHGITVNVRFGLFLVSDSGADGVAGSVYRIHHRRRSIETVADSTTIPEIQSPCGIAYDGDSHCVVADASRGEIYQVSLINRTAKKIADGMEGASGITWDHFGRLFVTSKTTGKVFGIPQPGKSPVLMSEELKSAADCRLSKDGRKLLIPDTTSGTLTEISTTIPGWEVDESPLPVEAVQAFPNLRWTGWDDGGDEGLINPLRPVLLTHAHDGSNQIYVATQHGVVHVFENSDDTTETKIFLDISHRVRYDDRTNEEGFLGLAFHPKFKENGEFFVFYTDQRTRLENVVSRFRVKTDDPTVADPDSEEELMRFKKPFWNHDGGTVIFGLDGYLYIAHGDGGAANDPHENGQNLKTWLGKVLRIDVDRKENGLNYAIPPDNPFIENAGAKPEIWAYGLRNIWRMAFDPETGVLWGGEVGQDLYEEIVLIERGGNYGWNLRESFHPFGGKGVHVRNDLIEPIWEYHHDIGKSITGGAVYRGKAIPELQGMYLYADYVSTRVWALNYDPAEKRVVANHPIQSPNLSVMSFGEDQHGELYLLRASGGGRVIYRLTRTTEK